MTTTVTKPRLRWNAAIKKWMCDIEVTRTPWWRRALPSDTDVIRCVSACPRAAWMRACMSVESDEPFAVYPWDYSMFRSTT